MFPLFINPIEATPATIFAYIRFAHITHAAELNCCKYYLFASFVLDIIFIYFVMADKAFIARILT